MLGHPLGTALLPLLLHQLLQLRLACVEAALVGGATSYRLQHRRHRGGGGGGSSGGGLLNVGGRPVGGLWTSVWELRSKVRVVQRLCV